VSSGSASVGQAAGAGVVGVGSIVCAGGCVTSGGATTVLTVLADGSAGSARSAGCFPLNIALCYCLRNNRKVNVVPQAFALAVGSGGGVVGNELLCARTTDHP
jgi:hypothetical protein